jgi:hypothetical protein
MRGSRMNPGYLGIAVLLAAGLGAASAGATAAAYLHDADALDWLGAIGVARIMALVDPNGGDPDGPKAVKMLEDNLKSVPPRVLSPAGRTIPPRKAELEGFLRELRGESENLQTL